jgi:antirestriction protein ArdC
MEAGPMTEDDPMNRTDAQKLSKQSLDDLAAQLEGGQSESLANFLAAMAKFHQYSWGNVLMILAQKPDATRIAGVRTWNRLGRVVRKGEKGIAIFAPMRFKAGEEGPAGEEDGDRIGFRVVHVFDIAQTDGEPLPEPETVTGDPTQHLADLHRAVADKGIRLEYHDGLGSAKGVSCKGTIKLLAGMTTAEEFSVLAHELAHELMHVDRRGADRRRAELEAEAVACVLCRYAGLDSGAAHSDYIRLYGGGKEALTESLALIQKTAADIIEAMTPQVEALAA